MEFIVLSIISVKLSWVWRTLPAGCARREVGGLAGQKRSEEEKRKVIQDLRFYETSHFCPLEIYTVFKLFYTKHCLCAPRPSSDIFQSANSDFSLRNPGLVGRTPKSHHCHELFFPQFVRIKLAQRRRQHTNTMERTMVEDIYNPNQQQPIISPPFFHSSLPTNVENCCCCYSIRISLRG